MFRAMTSSRRSVRFAALGLCACAAAWPATGQSVVGGAPPPAAEASASCEPGVTFCVETEKVVLHATVVDREDRFITDLTEAAFQVMEDAAVQPLTYFAQEDVPVSIGILIDNSGSMRDKRRQVNTAALEFVKASNPDDEVFIVNFDDEAYLDQDFTSDVLRLQDALQRIDSRGGTALYDAAGMSLDHLVEKGRADIRKRALLIISDGEDNASNIDLETLVRLLQESDATIYAIGLLTDEERRAAKRAERHLRTITRATGGPAYFPQSVDQVDSLVRRIAADIRNQYIVEYNRPRGKPAGYRRIKIELKGKAKRYSVRHRPGYYVN